MLVKKIGIGNTYLIELILSGLLLVAPDALAVGNAVNGVGFEPSGQAIGSFNYSGYAYQNRSDSISGSGVKQNRILVSQGQQWRMSVGLDRDVIDQGQWNLGVYFTSAFK